MFIDCQQIEKVYINFRKAQSHYNNRGFRLPKDFENHFNTKFKKQNQKALLKITGWFLTKWQNIDPYTYFQCGFELYGKNFSYTKFFKSKILLLYKTKDKNKKREIEITKKGLTKSAVFVKKWMVKNNSNLEGYIHEKIGEKKIAVCHYLSNKIDASFFVYLIKRGLILTDDDKSMMPYVESNFRKIHFGLNDIKDFVSKLGKRL